MRPTPSIAGARACACLLSGLLTAAAAEPPTTTPALAPGQEPAWRFAAGQWTLGDGVLEQKQPDGLGMALLSGPSFADFALSVAFQVQPDGPGVRAAAVAFRATGTCTYGWLHLDTRNRQVILVRSTPANSWIEIARRPCPALTDNAWHTVVLQCAGPRITVRLDATDVLQADAPALSTGRIGLGTSQGHVLFRDLRITGAEVAMSQPLKDEKPLFQVISRGAAAGPYQAFPDVCRLSNGDLLAVFYAGYGHVSAPRPPDWPLGGRLCQVRSTDDGRTWSEPTVLYDDADDNRDPHVAQLRDGSLVCSFFSLRWPAGSRDPQLVGVQLVTSTDGGRTWPTAATTVLPGWAVSAPVRELADGTRLLGVYYEKAGTAFGGVLRSTDQGRTWSEPAPIGQDAGLYLDAETDVVPLRDGSLYAALRSSRQNLHVATSRDAGRTWSAVRDAGFKGHCPHFTRLTTGEILLTVRLPGTALYVSRDEAQTWQGPYSIDTVGGAYPSTVERRDGTVVAVYYEEGPTSAVRALRFRLRPDGLEPLPWE